VGDRRFRLGADLGAFDVAFGEVAVHEVAELVLPLGHRLIGGRRLEKEIDDAQAEAEVTGPRFLVQECAGGDSRDVAFGRGRRAILVGLDRDPAARRILASRGKGKAFAAIIGDANKGAGLLVGGHGRSPGAGCAKEGRGGYRGADLVITECLPQASAPARLDSSSWV
jgi:hypothetical protein